MCTSFYHAGEEPYENVQQTSKGSLDRFKKMMKSTSKVCLMGGGGGGGGEGGALGFEGLGGRGKHRVFDPLDQRSESERPWKDPI